MRCGGWRLRPPVTAYRRILSRDFKNGASMTQFHLLGIGSVIDFVASVHKRLFAHSCLPPVVPETEQSFLERYAHANRELQSKRGELRYIEDKIAGSVSSFALYSRWGDSAAERWAGHHKDLELDLADVDEEIVPLERKAADFAEAFRQREAAKAAAAIAKVDALIASGWRSPDPEIRWVIRDFRESPSEVHKGHAALKLLDMIDRFEYFQRQREQEEARRQLLRESLEAKNRRRRRAA